MAAAFSDGSAAASSCSARTGEGTAGPAGTNAAVSGRGALWNAACPPACERATVGTVEGAPGACEVDCAVELAPLVAPSRVVRADSRFAPSPPPSPAEEPSAIAGGQAGSLKPVAPMIDRGAAATGAGRWDDAGANTAGAIPAWTWAAIGPFGANEAVDAKAARRRSPDEDAR